MPYPNDRRKHQAEADEVLSPEYLAMLIACGGEVRAADRYRGGRAADGAAPRATQGRSAAAGRRWIGADSTTEPVPAPEASAPDDRGVEKPSRLAYAGVRTLAAHPDPEALMHRDAVIPTFMLSTGTSITQASPWQTLAVTLESPALEVMTDLTKVKAATIHPDQTLRQAEQTMIYQGVRMLFVVNEMPVLEGLITSTDLHSERQMSLVHSRHLRFDEMRVADVMSDLSMLDAIALDSMRIATVSNLIATLRSLGRNHLLVVQAGAPGAAQQVRGVISRAQIERQLGQPVEVTERLGNFAEVVRALQLIASLAMPCRHC